MIPVNHFNPPEGRRVHIPRDGGEGENLIVRFAHNWYGVCCLGIKGSIPHAILAEDGL